MKLPKLPHQWEALDSFAKDRIDEASDQAAAFLVFAGYSSPQDLDENDEEIGDSVQSLLMDAMLRAPHLFLHITKLNELTHNVGEVELESAARLEFIQWTRNASLEDLNQQLAASTAARDAGEVGVAVDEIRIVKGELKLRSLVESDIEPDAHARYRVWAREADMMELRGARTIAETLVIDNVYPDAHWKLQIIHHEISLRQAGVARGLVVDWEAKAKDLPEHQRDYASRIWSSRYGVNLGPCNPEEWERFYRIGNEMNGTVGRDKDGK